MSLLLTDVLIILQIFVMFATYVVLHFSSIVLLITSQTPIKINCNSIMYSKVLLTILAAACPNRNILNNESLSYKNRA